MPMVADPPLEVCDGHTAIDAGNFVTSGWPDRHQL